MFANGISRYTFTTLPRLSNWIECRAFLQNKTLLIPHATDPPGSFTYRVLIGRVSIFEHKQNAGNVIIHSLPIHCDRRCTDVYVRTPRHLTLDGEAFHCAVGHAFLRMPGWYAEVSSGMQRHPIFADRSRLRPREFRLLHTASQAAPAGFKSTPRAAASKSDTWFYPLRSLSSSSTIHRFSVALPKAFEKNPDSSPRRFRALSACFIRMDVLSLP